MATYQSILSNATQVSACLSRIDSHVRKKKKRPWKDSNPAQK